MFYGILTNLKTKAKILGMPIRKIIEEGLNTKLNSLSSITLQICCSTESDEDVDLPDVIYLLN